MSVPTAPEPPNASVEVVPVQWGYEVRQGGDYQGFAALRSTAEEMAASVRRGLSATAPVAGSCPECADERRVRDAVTDTYASCPRCTCCECGEHVAIGDGCSECAAESGWLLHNRCCDGG